MRQLPPPVVRSENELALVAQLRGPLCPRLASLGGAFYSLRLLQARGDVLLYSLSSHCPECRYSQPPAFSWERPDGSKFCDGGGASGGACPELLGRLQVLTQLETTGTTGAVRAWLGCP